jgi:predicted adenylyl cyclase CyaB
VSRNVELKARDADPAATLARAHAAGAVEAGVLEQRDTYFAVPNGRLKLREERGGAATLVAYNRTNSTDARVSDYELVAVHDPPALARVLSLVLGIRTVVEKRRRLLMWEDTVRVHLDDVRGLGTFVEIEAVAEPGSDLADEHDQVARLAGALGIDRPNLVAAGYVDLIDG